MALTDRTTTETHRSTAVLDNDAVTRRPMFSTLRWGAILAGVVVGVSVQLALTLLGIATGLSTADVSTAESVSTSGPLLWAGISMLISAFIGGYVAARSSGLKRNSDGVLHGATAWGVTTLLFVAVAGAGAGNMLGGMFGSVGQAVTQAGSSSSTASSFLNRQFGNVSPGIINRFEQEIQGGNRNEAIALLTGSLDINQTQAATIVDQALIASGAPREASASGLADANRVIQMATSTAWMTFGAIALALVFGMSGGLMGASGARRIRWSENTAPQPAV